MWWRTPGINFDLSTSAVSALVSQWGFDKSTGGREGAAKVMVVVTDGESHDVHLREVVLTECDKKRITRFGIAVSHRPVIHTHPPSNCCKSPAVSPHARAPLCF